MFSRTFKHILRSKASPPHPEDSRPDQHNTSSHTWRVWCVMPPLPPIGLTSILICFLTNVDLFFFSFFFFLFPFFLLLLLFFFLSNLITFSFVNWTGILIQENCSLHKPPVFACWSRSLLVLCRMIVM
jgi:hypothetical protein